ncbi:hypothetical protein F5B22DRAFT_10733 [Xylaria bambusicola]|uniref:uncharacterized protein n=1 Tax=Xylaria bambusicola TaxID=326684 RepID=UPI002008725C|nr:uncharacterized protein F5B22DRAFT_10733 [Xylaria bambusicola]KAI0527921.1 hypothetical protein F5B22DRAFT_10733 [Xylaria bambusicola]
MISGMWCCSAALCSAAFLLACHCPPPSLLAPLGINGQNNNSTHRDFATVPSHLRLFETLHPSNPAPLYPVWKIPRLRIAHFTTTTTTTIIHSLTHSLIISSSHPVLSYPVPPARQPTLSSITYFPSQVPPYLPSYPVAHNNRHVSQCRI